MNKKAKLAIKYYKLAINALENPNCESVRLANLVVIYPESENVIICQNVV